MVKFIENEEDALRYAFNESIKSGKTFDVIKWKKKREQERIKNKSDWKKAVDKDYWIVWRKGEGVIQITKPMNEDGWWYVEINGFSDGYSKRTYKTKSDALAYAKMYMRNN